MSNEDRIKQMIKAALNGDPTVLGQAQKPGAFTEAEKQFILEQLALHTGASTTKDDESQCYVTVYASGEVAYTKGVDFADDKKGTVQ